MARLDVFRLTTGDIAIDCQSDLLDHLSTRFMVPLLDPDRVSAPMDKLHPRFAIDGSELVMATHLAGTIPTRSLELKITSLKTEEYIVQRALDTLTGSY